MQIEFTVHRANHSTVGKLIEVEGEPMTATVQSFEVELVDDHGGSYTRRFIGSEVDEAKKIFIPDQKVIWSIL